MTEELIINSNAKAAIGKGTPKPSAKRKKSTKSKVKSSDKRPKTQPTTNKYLPTEESDGFTDGKEGFGMPACDKAQEWEKNGTLTTTEIKLLESKYTKGAAAFGSEKNLQKSTKLKLRKVKKFLESKNAHTKHKKFRIRLPCLKVIAYYINGIWSLDLAHVDKLSEYNRGLNYLFVAVDCLSRYLGVELLHSKYATKTTKAFKKMIRNKHSEKVWVDADKEFRGLTQALCNRKKLKRINVSTKKSAFAERNNRSLKNLINKHLEHK